MTPTIIALTVSACLLGTGTQQGKLVCMKDLPISIPQPNTMEECRAIELEAIHDWEHAAHSTGLDWRDEHFKCHIISYEDQDG